jgi:hypothetical protein
MYLVPGKELVEEPDELLCCALGRQGGEPADVREEDTAAQGQGLLLYSTLHISARISKHQPVPQNL